MTMFLSFILDAIDSIDGTRGSRSLYLERLMEKIERNMNYAENSKKR